MNHSTMEAQPTTRREQAELCRCVEMVDRHIVLEAKPFRSGMMIVKTFRFRKKWRATKYGGRCWLQPGVRAIAKSNTRRSALKAERSRERRENRYPRNASLTIGVAPPERKNTKIRLRTGFFSRSRSTACRESVRLKEPRRDREVGENRKTRPTRADS